MGSALSLMRLKKGRSSEAEQNATTKVTARN